MLLQRRMRLPNHLVHMSKYTIIYLSKFEQKYFIQTESLGK